MGRKVAIVGAVLAAVGVVLQFAWFPSVPGWGSSPYDSFVNHVIFFAPTLGEVCATVGAVMLALALLMRLSSGAPVPFGGRMLLWAGLGAVLLAAIVNYVMQTNPTVYEVYEDVPVRLILGVMGTMHFIQLVGGALLGVWLTGRISSPTKVQGADVADPALFPSRPF